MENRKFKTLLKIAIALGYNIQLEPILGIYALGIGRYPDYLCQREIHCIEDWLVKRYNLVIECPVSVGVSRLWFSIKIVDGNQKPYKVLHQTKAKYKLKSDALREGVWFCLEYLHSR